MRLSIITITYNAERFLERTIKSLLAQDTKEIFEYLIIDGNSKDNTLSIAEKYKKQFINAQIKIISEPDKGLYDAMNKGLKLATGDFVWFMNAGDEIADYQAIRKISSSIDEQTDVLYGETMFVRESGEAVGIRSELTPHKLPKILHWQALRYGMLVCHQSFIARREIAPTYLSNNLSADVDWEIKCLKRARKIVYLDFIVSKYLIGGISNQQLTRSLSDRYVVIKKHFGFWGALGSHVVISARGLLKIARKGGKYW